MSRKRVIDLTPAATISLADLIPAWKGTEAGGQTVRFTVQQIINLVEGNANQPESDNDVFTTIP